MSWQLWPVRGNRAFRVRVFDREFVDADHSSTKEAHMLKSIATFGALSALMIAPAVAQTGSPPTDKPAMHESAKPAAPAKGSAAAPSTAKDSSASTTPASTTGTATAAAKPDFISEQKPDQFLASSFKGTDVLGPDDKKIGDVNDILFEKDGSVKAYVVGVGGFLGIGSKNVALAPSSFQVVPGKDPSDTKLKLSMNKDELKQAASFKAYHAPTPQRTTTGMAPRAGGGLPSR
jgi:hypothetical protein